jgi:hypothetical protein
MKLSIITKLSTVILLSFMSCAAFAADQFFEVGKSYLFVPRIGVVMKGTVTQITDQEVVFTDRSILKASKASDKIKNDDAKAANINGAAIAAYLKSDKRESLLEACALKNIPTSYSRSEMTAVKIES